MKCYLCLHPTQVRLGDRPLCVVCLRVHLGWTDEDLRSAVSQQHDMVDG